MMHNGMLLSIQPVPIPHTILNMRKRTLSEQEYKNFAAVQLFSLTYHNQGLTIAGYLALPPADQSVETYPAIIFNRGGTGPKGALTPESAAMYIALYASWGYVVVASQYRGSGGSEGFEEWGGNDIEDVKALLQLLISLPYVDKDRIGLIGGSRGGMMALMMLRSMHNFKAAVTIGAPTYFHDLPKDSYIYKTFAHFQDSAEKIKQEELKRSAVTFADELCKTTPLLVLHGTGDKRVDPMHSFTLCIALQKANHPYKLIMYENADHILAGRRDESNHEIYSWMNTYVKEKKPLPKVGPHGA